MPSTVEPTPHPDLASLAFLLGNWAGEGRGEYPTIADFAYGDELRFWHVGKPFLGYSQRSWNLETGATMHVETGYWRPGPGNVVEVVLAHPMGVAEILEGRVDGETVVLDDSRVTVTSTAKEVTALARRYVVAGDVLTSDTAMAAMGVPLTHHLHAELRRTAG